MQSPDEANGQPEQARTLEAIRRRQNDRKTAVVPTEYARAPTYRNPPGATALKILHAMIDHAGASIDDHTTWHEMPLRNVIGTANLRHLGAQDADEHLSELNALQLSYWLFDVQRRKTIVSRGVVVERAEIHLPEDRGNEAVTIRWRFGSIFTEIARSSHFYTLLANNVIWSLRSRYAIALFHHISGLSGQRHRSVRFTVPELRDVLGVVPKKLQRFKDLNARALKPALDQINACEYARWTLKATIHKRARKVHAVEISWTPRKEEAQQELVLDDDEQASTATPATAKPPPFPADGRIVGTAWGQAARAHAPGHDPDRVGHDFARWIRNKGGRLDAPEITASFETFAKGYDAVQGRNQPAPADWDGPAERTRSPYSDFPRNGLIRDTVFAGLVATHAPAVDPDTIGQAFAERLRGVGVPFEAPDTVSHEEDFARFCQAWPHDRTPA